jgi:prepilin-type N-terminal cleavage/methylation domain-containing protein
MDRVVLRHEPSESGFTLIEVMISAVILMSGLLSLAYAFGLGLGAIDSAQMDSIARQKARQAMEDVFTARDTGGISFNQICNQPTSGCLFLSATTWQPLYTAGPDGLVFTSDDGTAAAVPQVVNTGDAGAGATLPQGCSAAPCVETIDTPGPNGTLGTSQDIFVPLNGYLRNITITPVGTSGTLNQIVVTIRYTTPNGITRSVTLVSFIGQYV